MDPVSGLKGELFRPLVTVLLPGLVAASPFMVIAVHRFPELAKIQGSPVATGAMILFIGTLSGMLMEDLGSQVETFIWWLFLKTPKRDREWEAYLRLKTKDEFVGQRYLDSVQLRLKFELNMIPAVLAVALGSVMCNRRCKLISPDHLNWWIALLIAVALYLLWEAKKSSLVLSDTRAEVISGYREEASRAAPSKASPVTTTQEVPAHDDKESK